MMILKLKIDLFFFQVLLRLLEFRTINAKGIMVTLDPIAGRQSLRRIGTAGKEGNAGIVFADHKNGKGAPFFDDPPLHYRSGVQNKTEAKRQKWFGA